LASIAWFGPVGANRGESLSATEQVIFVGAIIALLLVSVLRYYLRRRHLIQQAKQHGWQWIGAALPRHFPLRELVGEPNRTINVENAMAGVEKGKSFFAFDAKIGEGRRVRRITLIAANSTSNPFGQHFHELGWDVVEADGWFALKAIAGGFSAGYRTMTTSEIVAHIESIS
jgi:hypothetical protein